MHTCLTSIDSKYDWKYDTWEGLQRTLSMCRKLTFDHLEIKPSANSPDMKEWQMQMDIINRWTIETHYRLINYNMRNVKSAKLHYK